MLLHIVGGGPAGSIAAISALRNGYGAVISEEHESAGVPIHCSGLFSKDGLERLSGYADYRQLVINPIHGAIVDIAGVRLDIEKSEPVAFVCNRAGLDQKLIENAVSEGAKAEYGKKIGNTFLSDYIIGADGPFSSVARTFAFPKITKYVSALQAILPYRCEDPHRVEVYLSNEKFPGFFAWIIPQNEEYAEFGVGVVPPHNVSKAWGALLKLKQVSFAGVPKGAAIPIRARAKTGMVHGKHKVCLVGDAAGQTKATTGGGVIFGGQCAMLAGMHASDPAKYESSWRSKHGMDLWVHSMLQSQLEKQSDNGLRSIATSLKNFEFDKYLSEHGHMDRPTNMLNARLVSHFVKAALG